MNEKEELYCECGEKALKKRVSKDGLNKGRYFFACPRPFGEPRCNFFRWESDQLSLEGKVQFLMEQNTLMMENIQHLTESMNILTELISEQKKEKRY